MRDDQKMESKVSEIYVTFGLCGKIHCRNSLPLKFTSSQPFNVSFNLSNVEILFYFIFGDTLFFFRKVCLLECS